MVEVAFVIPRSSINLYGVNTTPLTGGPRLTFGAPVLVSRCELGIFRTGTNVLAGLDPMPDFYEDPAICFRVYCNYAEWVVNQGIVDLPSLERRCH